MSIWILFFFSGLAGLIYEILWVRELVLVFGATTFAIATVLTAFMGGLALGSHLFGRRADRLVSPLRVYAFLEIAIGLYALAVHPLFGALVPVYRTLWKAFHLSFYPFSLLRFVLVTLILIFPTTCMGGTLPLLAAYSARREGSAAVGRIGGLYAVNTLGAVLGVLFCAFLFLPALGTFRTTLLVASINLLVGAAALVVARHAEPLPNPLSLPHGERIKAPSPHHLLILATFALSGYAAMVYEVAWTRLLTQVLGSTIYSFATLLATFLLGLALGSAFFSLLVRRMKRPLGALGLIQCGIGLLAFGGEYLFGKLPAIFLGMVSLLHSAQGYLPAAKFLLAALVMFPAAFLMGGVFPVALRLLFPFSDAGRSSAENAGAETGRAYAFNTVGTIFGSFMAGFLLLPLLGMQRTLALGVAVNLGLAVGLFLREPSPHPRRGWATGGMLTGGILAVITFSFFSGPRWDPLSLSSEIFGKSKSMELLFYREGLNAAVTVAENPTLDPFPHLTMAIDGKANASTAGDMPTQILVGQLPILLGRGPEKAFVIGLGSGITLGSVAQHPLKEIVVAELEPAVVEASRYFDSFNNRPLEDPRVHLLVEDARNYLLVTPDRFDAIVSEPSHPWRSGSAKLFTKEFFELGRKRLNPGGIFAQWIHFYGIKPRELKGVIRTFHAVFPEILLFYTPAGDLILLGRMEPFRIDPSELENHFGVSRVGFELRRINVASVYDLFSYFIMGTEETEAYLGPDGPLNTDDDTFVEFQTPKSLFEDTLAVHLGEMNRHHRGVLHLFGESTDEAETAARMAEAYQKRGLLSDADRSIRRALSLRPDADRYRRLALILEEQGREEEAAGAWTAALGIRPNHPATLMDLTRFEFERGDLPKMGTYLDRWKLAAPGDPRLPYYEGVRLYYDGKAPEALRAFDLAGAAGGPLAEYYRSLAFSRLGRSEEARAALNHFFEGLNLQRKRLEENPKRFNALPLLRARRLRADLGVQIAEEERLAQLFDRIVGEPLDHFYGGMGLYMLGLFPEAAVELSKGLDQLGERRHGSLGQFYLGMTYRKMGRYKEATELLRDFVLAGGDGGFRIEEAKRALEEILQRQGGKGVPQSYEPHN